MRYRETKARDTGLSFCFWLIWTLALGAPEMVMTQTHQGEPVNLGYRAFSYDGGVSEITEEKPESKLWYHDGHWWGVLWDNSSARFTIHRFDAAAGIWTNTFVLVDDRDRTAADVISDGGKLYVSSRARTNMKDGDSPIAELLRYTYNPELRSYSLDPGFPVRIPGTERTPALTIARDSWGRIWATWTSDANVMVNATDGTDTHWGVAFKLPVQGEPLLDSDISAVTAFKGDRIGILWSNQRTEAMYFAVHRDDSSDAVWAPRETVLDSIPSAADDHINLAIRESDGTILATTKTGLSGSNNPEIYLNKRDPDSGLWSNHIVWLTVNNLTRPITLYNSDSDSVYVLATEDSNPRKAYYKVAHIDNLDFAPTDDFGKLFIWSVKDSETNNLTSTKQMINDTTGLLAIASEKNTKYYLQNYLRYDNNRPVANADAYIVNQGEATVLDVTSNDRDSDGAIDPTTIFIVEQADSGTVTVNSSTGAVTYTPSPAFTGRDEFLYTVADDDGDYAQAARIAVIVARVSDTITVLPNYPNPFNGETKIVYSLPQSARVKLEIFNVRGRLVRTLVDEQQEAGFQRIRWQADDNDGNSAGSGVYFMRLEVGSEAVARRLILQK